MCPLQRNELLCPFKNGIQGLCIHVSQFHVCEWDDSDKMLLDYMDGSIEMGGGEGKDTESLSNFLE